MWIEDDMMALGIAWLTLTTFVVIWTVKIALLVYRQRRAEVAYRLHLAALRGAALRAMEASERDAAG
jgi:hypothetical protein